MDKEDSKTLQHISDTLDEMLTVMRKPENKFERVLNIIAAVVTISSIISIIETIGNWIGG